MGVDSSSAAYLKKAALYASASPAGLAWPGAVASEAISPLAAEAAAAEEAARQAEVLGGPNVRDRVVVAGARRDLVGRWIRAAGDRLGYQAAPVALVVKAEEQDGGTTVLTLVRRITGAAPPPPPPPPPKLAARYIAPTASGLGDGSDWNNAAPLSALNTQIAQATAIAGEVWLRADAGPYARDGAITIDKGGAADHPVVIRGVDVNGFDLKAEIIGSRYVDTSGTYNWGDHTTQKYGNELFRLNAGADNLFFRHIRFRNQGSGCIRIRQDIANLTIEDCDAYNVARFVEGGSAGGAPTASVNGFTMRRCQGHGYSKGFCRLRYASTNILIEDCLADSERQDGDNFAAGFTFHDTAGPGVLRRCVARGHIDSYHAYQQGDGFSSEIGNRSLRFEDCEAYNNTDGGWDCKSDWLELVRCKSVGNHRNYRIWGLATLTDCISETPKDNAGANGYSKAHVIVMSGALCRIYGGRFTDTGSSTYIFNSTEGGILAYSPTTQISGGQLKREEAGVGNNPAAVITTLNPNDRSTPVIDPAVTSFAVDENKSTKRPVVTTDKRVITIRNVNKGGVLNRASFNLLTSRQDFEDTTKPNPRSGSIIAYDTNGNASAVTPVYVTVNNVDDDPISPQDLRNDGCTDFGWWDPSAAGGLWQDLAMTVPAVDDDDPVSVIADLSGFGHHWVIADGYDPPLLQVSEGLSWIEASGAEFFQCANLAELRFAQATSIHAIRRDKVDTSTNYFMSHASGSNMAWGQSVLGGASFRITIGSTSDASTAGGNSVGKDVVLGFQTRPYEGRSNDGVLINVSDTDSKTPSYLSGSRARLFADGNGANRYVGRWYGAVVTNRTETDAIRFRLTRQMGQLAGLEL